MNSEAWPFRSIFDLISCSPVTPNLMKMISICPFSSKWSQNMDAWWFCMSLLSPHCIGHIPFLSFFFFLLLGLTLFNDVVQSHWLEVHSELQVFLRVPLHSDDAIFNGKPFTLKFNECIWETSSFHFGRNRIACAPIIITTFHNNFVYHTYVSKCIPPLTILHYFISCLRWCLELHHLQIPL